LCGGRSMRKDTLKKSGGILTNMKIINWHYLGMLQLSRKKKHINRLGKLVSGAGHDFSVKYEKPHTQVLPSK